tara:strand:- start:11840 stop:12382 length:543 start_codon:yes stop_codon:yes gene_type:complete
MSKNIKLGFQALMVSLIFETIIMIFFNENSYYLSFLSFAFHSLNMIIFILFSVIFMNPIISRVANFKKGLTVSLIFSFFISFYFFSYHKWINPNFLISKKKELTEMILTDQMLKNANNQIIENPDYFNGKSADDLIEMQQDNIEEFLQPSKVFPISLFGFLLIGLVFTAILSVLNYSLNK